MQQKITLETYQKAYSEIYKKQRKKSFSSHLLLYILINTVSTIINLLFTPNFLWVIFPIVFWGIGVFWNYLGAFIWIDRNLQDTFRKAENLAQKIQTK